MQGRQGRDAFAELNAPEFLAALLDAEMKSRMFDRLVRLTHDSLFAFARRHFSSREECQEVLQETYLAVHKGLAGFQGGSKLTTWIYSLAYHKICDQIAVKTRRREEALEPEESAADPEARADSWSALTPWEASADRVLAKSAAEILIAEAIRLLVPPGSEVYRLRDVEGFSGEEVAAMLGISPENVRVLLHRTRKQIVEWVRNKMAAGPTNRKGAA
ncbi:MAG: polymerase, sigma-24 subunit, subfamily [Fibrobacteria bacterium]|jgi:RNA polymerase sigma-70 factor (ECF subfamily)|nr:polymerase, sigma-24 subunit, subfamily [Fibrobacteria bacterium]